MSEPTNSLHQLSEALQRFASSSRFNFLKTLQVGRFLQDEAGTIGVVSEFTFEKLVELGTKKIAKLRWLNSAQEGRLVELLDALSESDGGLTIPPAAGRPPPSGGKKEPTVAAPEEEYIGSVEVELRLRQALQDMKNHPDFNAIANLPLGKFWDPSWARAPFEEAITMEQLSEMDLSILLKKRTMTNQRIDKMAKAATAALQSLRGAPEQISTPSTQESPQPLQSRVEPPRRLTLVESLPPKVTTLERQRALPIGASVDHAWLLDSSDISPLIRAGAERFLLACLAALDRKDTIDALLGELPEQLLLDEFLLLLGDDWKPDELTPRMRMWIGTEEFARHTSLLRAALQSPGVHLSCVAALLDGGTFAGSLAELGATVLVKLLGAQEVRLGDERCTNVWTLNPEMLGVLVKAMRREQRASVEAILATVCPNIDPALREWLVPRLKKSGKKARTNTGQKR